MSESFYALDHILCDVYLKPAETQLLQYNLSLDLKLV